ncbi:hypothetical protein Y032_0008g34 [Ancylostoma ceylanicum]|uniref:RRM domain-containing protein n=2 Tax=Ancylostoma ceylanicum TaxID=53326 RepID=A0A016VL23_9BILA|nr:hypothetical protein Y032_0008g34 [Ancylostoma ceylanicum]
MSYGGYGNRGGYDYQRRDRINEDEVPESKHTIFIRGLPGDMSTDEIKEYFEDRIGPVSFDFVKTSADQQRLFVAVRFETRDDAKEAMSKYSDSDLMGHRCELTWFKDIRRYAQYQSLNQQRRGRPVFRRGYQYNNNSSRGRDAPRRRYSDRDDDRSRSRSRDRGRSSSYSRSPSRKSGDSSRSRSRSSERAASEDRNRRSSSRDSNSAQGREKDRDGDSDRKHRKKDRKHKKSKKKRSGSGSRSSSEDRSSTPEQAIFGRHAPAGSPVSPNQEDSPTPSAPAAADPPPKAEAEQPNTDLAPPPLPPPIISPSPVRFPIRIQTPANVIGSTTFAIGIDSDEPPRKVLRRMSPPAGSAVTPPSVAAQEEEKLAHEAQETVMAAIDLPPPPNPPMFSSEKKVNSSLCKSEQQDKKPATPPSELPSAPTPVQQSTISSLSETPSKLASSRFPTTTRLFTQLKEIQSTIIKTVKVEPKSNEASGGLRLSSLATCQQDTDEEKRAIRENRLSKLDEISLERFMVRKKKLEETFRGDCQTYAFVTRKLIEKDPSLESQLRIALIENMEDLEKQVYEQVDVYLDTICD